MSIPFNMINAVIQFSGYQLYILQMDVRVKSLGARSVNKAGFILVHSYEFIAVRIDQQRLPDHPESIIQKSLLLIPAQFGYLADKIHGICHFSTETKTHPGDEPVEILCLFIR
jgi:hypothetical protein